MCNTFIKIRCTSFPCTTFIWVFPLPYALSFSLLSAFSQLSLSLMVNLRKPPLVVNHYTRISSSREALPISQHAASLYRIVVASLLHEALHATLRGSFVKLFASYRKTLAHHESSPHLWLVLHMFSRICLLVSNLSLWLHKQANGEPMENLCVFVNTQMKMLFCYNLVGLPMLISSWYATHYYFFYDF